MGQGQSGMPGQQPQGQGGQDKNKEGVSALQASAAAFEQFLVFSVQWIGTSRPFCWSHGHLVNHRMPSDSAKALVWCEVVVLHNIAPLHRLAAACVTLA